jgi:hypothetical protein
VVRGRCLSYGEGITYWPVVEIVKQFEMLPAGDAARPLRSLLGETELPASAEEIAWGFRKLLEQEAQAQPLVCVFDDLHWGEETLFDLVEHVADLSRDAPVLLLCMARPELLERRPSWGGGKWNATAVLLEPLDVDETEQLLSALGEVPPELHERIVEVAEGNPLFLEEMLALVHDSGGGEVEVPPTIQALLAARLDQLDPAERSVLEHGAVEGRTFHRGAVAALADGGGSVDQRLVALVRKELVRPDRPQLPGDDAYRFRHLLIRDAAYDALPKATRADLHRRFAVWLEVHGQNLIELDEILGYHLEQAARYLEELGRADPELALTASDRLAAAGLRAHHRRGDANAAAALLERALLLSRPHRLDVHREVDLAYSLADVDMARAAAICARAADEAQAAGETGAELLARTYGASCGVSTGAASPDDVEQLSRAAVPVLEAAHDDVGLYYVWLAFGYAVANVRGRFEDLAESEERSIRHAVSAGRAPRLEQLPLALALGPRPAGEALETLDAALLEHPFPQGEMLRAYMLAQLDRADEAQTLAAEIAARRRELGQKVGWPAWFAEVIFLGGSTEEAIPLLRELNASLEAANKTAELSTYSAWLGRYLCALGRYEEAAPLAQQSRDLGDEQDALTQIEWRRVQALVLSHRNEHAEAERLAREAVAIAENSDSPVWQGDAVADLAQVLDAAGRHDDSIAAWQQALDHYERKGVIPLAQRTRKRIAALQATPS